LKKKGAPQEDFLLFQVDICFLDKLHMGRRRETFSRRIVSIEMSSFKSISSGRRKKNEYKVAFLVHVQLGLVHTHGGKEKGLWGVSVMVL
jgi:hypothetical protein